MKKYISIAFLTLFVNLLMASVSLEIQNVNTDAGTLDIYMTNQAGCSYCTDDLYDNQNLCETYGDDGTGDASWVFDSSMDDIVCADTNGIWFNGEVGGFQFELPGVTITGASGGTASEYFAIVNTTSSIILGFDSVLAVSYSHHSGRSRV